MSDLKIGFVGLGDQGGPMAVAIAQGGFELHVWARRPQSLEAMGDAPCTLHGSLQSLAETVTVLCLCLRDDQDIWDLLQQQALARALRSGSILVNHGTGDPGENARIGTFLQDLSITYLDAPISGGRPGAVARTLTTMVGGEATAAERCLPVFESFSRKVALMGPVGSGQLAKLLNNALTMTNLKNAVDVFALARDLGMDIQQFYDVINVSSGASTVLQFIGNQETLNQSSLETARHLQVLMLKDIKHFADAIRDRGLDPAELERRGIGGAKGLAELTVLIEGPTDASASPNRADTERPL
jgi:3-hydroxyisobutyrate dehydrogenase-like beta-hydroxyacid dehydrogenase